tara:strand:- start:472 stop:774 length:303 start_codon:yes stop_codon:yes gene_type:complete
VLLFSISLNNAKGRNSVMAVVADKYRYYIIGIEGADPRDILRDLGNRGVDLEDSSWEGDAAIVFSSVKQDQIYRHLGLSREKFSIERGSVNNREYGPEEI